MSKKIKILCIDDEREGLVMRKMMLEAEGYRMHKIHRGNACSPDASTASESEARLRTRSDLRKKRRPNR
jgi:hypothetical protein